MKAVKDALTNYVNELKLTEEQRECLSKYSRLRTANRFEREAIRLIGSPELVKDWFYGGYHDTGYFGGGKCSLGHTLRYAHLAINKETNEKVIFGIKCVTDFFKLTSEQLKLIQLGVAEVNIEINQIYEKLYKYGSFSNYALTTKIVKKFLLIEEKPQDYNQILEFFMVGLPLTSKLEWQINNIYNKEASKRDFKEFLSQNVLYWDLITKAQNISIDSNFKEKHAIVWNKINDIVNYLKKYRNLTEPQIKLLTKMLSVDYEEIDKMFDELYTLPEDKFIKFNGFDEFNMLKSIHKAYEDWGISIKQVESLTKSYNKHLKAIEEIKTRNLEDFC